MTDDDDDDDDDIKSNPYYNSSIIRGNSFVAPNMHSFSRCAPMPAKGKTIQTPSYKRPKHFPSFFASTQQVEVMTRRYDARSCSLH